MMNIRSLALACAVVTIPAAIAAPSPAFQQAILAELDQATRAEVQRRATGGNSIYEVLAVTLLNNVLSAAVRAPRRSTIENRPRLNRTPSPRTPSPPPLPPPHAFPSTSSRSS